MPLSAPLTPVLPLVRRLREEASASEELDATDSSVATMRDAASLIEELVLAVQALHDALNSDPPDGGPQKHVAGDDVIYRLDGQAMYQAINRARAALARACR